MRNRASGNVKCISIHRSTQFVAGREWRLREVKGHTAKSEAKARPLNLGLTIPVQSTHHPCTNHPLSQKCRGAPQSSDLRKEALPF